jgi:hypothetical protein
MGNIEHWSTASCCGEPRVTRHVDRCYDHAKVCVTCDEPSVDGVCPACQLAGAVALEAAARKALSCLTYDGPHAISKYDAIEDLVEALKPYNDGGQ